MLQWGRAPEGAERAPPPAVCSPMSRLQWGRAPEGAERVFWRFESAPSGRFNGAAPRRARRGHRPRRRSLRARGFNGAAPRRARREQIQDESKLSNEASMGPRPGGRGEQSERRWSAARRSLQWGRAPEGAESAGWPTVLPRSPRFNGAAPRRARRVLHLLQRRLDRQASMGPRPGGRGEVRSAEPTGVRDELQWGRAPEGAERRAMRRKCAHRRRLQWGRAPEGAESADQRRSPE